MHPRGDRRRPRGSNPNMVLLRQLSRALEDVTRLLPGGETVLDLGCAEKPYRDLFVSYRRYIGFDLPGNPLADLIGAGNREIPIKDHSVDCVLSTQVLEHVADPRRYLKEAFRILKPGGYLVLSTHGIYDYHPDPVDYWRWTSEGLGLELNRCGFDIIQIRGLLRLLSASLLLFQKATGGSLPRLIRLAYFWIFQRVIGLVERVGSESGTVNAVAYVALCRKPEEPRPSLSA